MSCGDLDSTVQGSCPHKCGQDVSCGHLMRRCQFLLELLLLHTPMVDSLHLCFPLRRSRRLPLAACRFFLPWSRFTEDRIVLGNVSWQFGPSSFVFEHFFLFWRGLGLDMKPAGVAKFFGSTIALQNPAVRLLGRRGGFWCPQAYVTARRVWSFVSARASSPAQGTLLVLRYTRRTVINAFMERCGLLRYTRRAFISAFMKRCGFNGWRFPWKLGRTYFAYNSFFEFRVN